MRHLVWQEMVSLPDDPTVTISYKDLEQYEQDEGPHYAWRPRDASKYTVRELMEGIEDYRIAEDKRTGRNRAVRLRYVYDPYSTAQDSPPVAWQNRLHCAYAPHPPAVYLSTPPKHGSCLPKMLSGGQGNGGYSAFLLPCPRIPP